MLWKTWEDFAIWIEGFAVQSDVSAEYEGFKTWAGTGVVFNKYTY